MSLAAWMASIEVYIRVALGDLPAAIAFTPGKIGRGYAADVLGRLLVVVRAPNDTGHDRWVQFGVFMPRFSIHSWNDDGTVNEPWMYPEATAQVRARWKGAAPAAFVATWDGFITIPTPDYSCLFLNIININCDSHWTRNMGVNLSTTDVKIFRICKTRSL